MILFTHPITVFRDPDTSGGSSGGILFEYPITVFRDPDTPGGPSNTILYQKTFRLNDPKDKDTESDNTTLLIAGALGIGGLALMAVGAKKGK